MGCEEGVSHSLPGEWSGEGAMPKVFLAQNGKFWCILGANFIAVELPVLHAYAGKPMLWLVKPAIASLCVKNVGEGL